MKLLLISLATFGIGLGTGLFLPQPVAPPLSAGAAMPDAKTADGKGAGASSSKTPRQAAAATVPSATVTAPAEDPFTAWQEALRAGTLTDLQLRGELLQRMTRADPPRAWRELMASGLPVSRKEVRTLAETWYGKDPAAAAAFGLTLTDPLQRPAFLQQVLSRWMLEKPGAFAAWFDTQPAHLELAQYLNTSSVGYLPGSCTLADLDGLLHVNAGFSGFPDVLGRQLSSLWGQRDQRQATQDWVRRVEDPQLRDQLWRHLAATAGADDPQSAMAMLNEISDAKLRRQASSTLSAHMARKNPQAALDYAATLPDTTAATSAWQSALCTWAANEPRQALDFIRQNASSMTPATLNPAAHALGASLPADALAVVEAFPQSKDRDMLVMSLIVSWQAKSPEATRRWLESPQSAALLPPDSSLRQVLVRAAATVSSPRPRSGTFQTTINGRPLMYVY